MSNNICPKNPRIECISPGPTREGGCCRYIPPGRPIGFGVIYRNPGHWDIATDYGRAFRIRGGPNEVLVADHREDDARPHPRDWLSFRSVGLAMAWCAEELMNPKPVEKSNEEST